MFPLAHIIAGGIFSGILYLIFPISFFEVLIVFLSSFLIDVDHYLCYVLWKRDFSLKNANKWFVSDGKKYDGLTKTQKRNYTLGVFPLHGFEMLFLILLLGYWQVLFFFVFVGFAFHLISDFVYEVVHSKRALYRFSLIYSLLYKWPRC
ncbi:MAG: hypothetical protein KKD94_03365 [Nanoarchaeota archaeon]|nr:hypothetical protein [Nanoarchaeota archaeon]